MKAVCHIVKGPYHKECEDSALIMGAGRSPMIFHENRTETEISSPVLIAAADGVGGLPGGRKASEFAVRTLSTMNVSGDETTYAETLKEINRRLIDYAATVPGQNTMATTLSMVYLDGDTFKIAHTGNTRIQTLNGGYLRQVSTDHTTYQMLMDRGMPEEAEKAPKNEIISCLGGGNEKQLYRIQVNSLKVSPNQKMIILTSDGIHDYVDIDFMEDTLNRDDLSLGEKADLLILQALKLESEDDKTVLIVEL